MANHKTANRLSGYESLESRQLMTANIDFLPPCPEDAPCVSADFNWDGKPDLAIGLPNYTVNGVPGAGAVEVWYSTPQGGYTKVLLHQDSPGIEGVAEPYDHFGASLTKGDTNGDDHDELGVGVPDEDIGTIVDAGAVHIIFSSPYGLDGLYGVRDDQLWHQNSPGVRGTAEPGDHFGTAVLLKDLTRNGIADLLVGAPDEDINGKEDAGVVHAIYGSYARGLDATEYFLDDQVWHQDSHDVKGKAEAGDRFGAAIAAGYFDGGPFIGVAIGVPGEDIKGIEDAGAVNVIYSSLSGLDATNRIKNDQIWHQNSKGVEDKAEARDHFGATLLVNDYNFDGTDDLLIGVPGEDVNGHEDIGARNLIFGSYRYGLNATRYWQDDQFWF